MSTFGKEADEAWERQRRYKAKPNGSDDALASIASLSPAEYGLQRQTISEKTSPASVS